MNNLDEDFSGLVTQTTAVDWAEDDLEKDTGNYIGPGDVNQFDMCPAKTYYSKIRKEPFQYDIGFHYSSVLRQVCNGLASGLKTNGRLPTVAEAWSLPHKFDKEASLIDYWYKNPETWEDPPSKDELDDFKGKIDSLATLASNEFFEGMRPYVTNLRLYAPVPGGEEYRLHLHDFIDLISEEKQVYMYKFSGRSLGGRISGDIQQNLLAKAALLHNFKLPEKGMTISIAHFISTKTPKLEVIGGVITPLQMQSFVNKMLAQWKILAEGLHTTNRACAFCKSGKGGCSYYDICTLENY